MSGPPRGPRGRGRGRGRGGQNYFQEHSTDGDMNMSDARPFQPRGRGRGYQGGQNQQQRPYDGEGDQAMYDANTSRGRGRGGRGRGPRGGQNHFQQRDYHQQEPAVDKAKLEANPAYPLMRDFLGRRYDQPNKLLNLSHIVSDQEILESGMFATDGAQRKFFPALMVVCDNVMDQEAKEAAIESVSLSNNGLANTHAVYQLCNVFRHIKNLDLSNNAFATIDALRPWKGRFRNLEHLIVDPFPASTWEDEMISWFPKLKILNGKQVRPANNANNANNINNNTHPAMNNPSPQPTPTPVPTITNPEQQQKEEMILYVQRETNLKRDYALQCLEAAQWNIDQAGVLFTQSQPSLPPEAYN